MAGPFGSLRATRQRKKSGAAIRSVCRIREIVQLFIASTEGSGDFETGNQSIYIAHSSLVEEKEYIQLLHVKLDRYKYNGMDGMWFPKEVIFRTTVDGAITREQVTTVDEAVFGEDLPKETFTLEGLRFQ